MARLNPYTRLKQVGQEFFAKIKYRRKELMWTYPKDQLNEFWDLYSLNERVAAAKQLGYAVELKATNKGLEVWYVKQIPSNIPWEFVRGKEG